MLRLKQTRTLYCFLIVLLLAFGIFFRVANLDRKPYWGDESLTSQRISGYIDREFKSIVLQNNPMTAGELQNYQRPNSNKDLKDWKNWLRKTLVVAIASSGIYSSVLIS